MRLRRRPQTFWNGEPAFCRRVKVRVGPSPSPKWWCSGLKGMVRRAVLVRLHGEIEHFLIDDQQGMGWRKVTKGKGDPAIPHQSLPATCEVLEYLPSYI